MLRPGALEDTSMKQRIRNKLILRSLALGLLLLALCAAISFSPAATDLSWNVIAGGGATVQTGDMALSGTLGQPVAGPYVVNGTTRLASGFWWPETYIYLPMIRR